MSTSYISNQRVVAVVIGQSLGDEIREGTNFCTDPSASLQVGVLHRKEGTHIKAHQHTQVKKEVVGCQEVIIIRKGVLRADIYDPEERLIATVNLGPGQVLIQYIGGHSFLALTDVQMIEVKQGPYKASEKVFFNPLDHEQMK